MKKVLLYEVAVVLVMLLMCSSAFAFEGNEFADGGEVEMYEMKLSELELEVLEESLELCYVSVQKIKIGFAIQEGIANCTCKVTPKTTASITSVSGVFKIVKSSGNVVKTYTRTMNKSNGSFWFSENYKLKTRGIYYMKATITCYKNGVKQETITKTTSRKNY